MQQQPILATVVAIELHQARPELAAGSRVDEFAQLLVMAIAQSCSVQRQIRGDAPDGLTLVMPPEAPAGLVLRRTAGCARQFEARYAGERVRLVVHHGVVFATRDGKREGYIGSALRSAHSILRRLDGAADHVATPEFVGFAREWPASPLSFTALDGRAAVEGLFALRIDADGISDEELTIRALRPDDAELQRFLAHRLAEDVGPFSSVLVEAARRTATSVEALIVELSHEVDDAAARARFVGDVQTYVDGRRGVA